MHQVWVSCALDGAQQKLQNRAKNGAGVSCQAHRGWALVHTKSGRAEVGRALVKITSGRAEGARALVKIRSGPAEVARPLVRITS